MLKGTVFDDARQRNPEEEGLGAKSECSKERYLMAQRRKGRGSSRGSRGKEAKRDRRKWREGTVLSVLGKGYYVQVVGEPEQWFCRVRGRLFLGEGITWPVVGDRVWVEARSEEKKGIICEIVPRRSVLARLAPETRHQQVLASNLDRVLICMAIKDPPFRPGLIDRYLVSCEALNLDATIVVNKVDLATEDEIHSAVAEFQSIGYGAVFTSAEENRGIDELRSLLMGQTSVLTGPSGAGKSSLVNRICPGIDLKTGSVNEVTGRGRHTTTASRLIDVGGGFLVDTPGIREFSLWGITQDNLAECFVDLRPFLNQCRFRDCKHRVEPDCLVQDAVTQGEISPRRFQSYKDLFVELSDGVEVANED